MLKFKSLLNSSGPFHLSEPVTFSLPLCPSPPNHSCSLLLSVIYYHLLISFILSPGPAFLPSSSAPDHAENFPLSPLICLNTLICLFRDIASPSPLLHPRLFFITNLSLTSPPPSRSSSFYPNPPPYQPPPPPSQNPGRHRPGDPAAEERGGRRVGGEGGGQAGEEGQRDEEGEVGASGQTDQAGGADREGR